MGYGLDGQEIGVRFPTGARHFSILHSAQNESVVTHPPKKWVPETLPPRAQRLEREADQSHSSSAEIKNECNYTSLPHTSSWNEWWLIN
jgi:hypothetical protein